MALTDIKRISIREYLGAMGIKPQRERGNRAMYLSPFRDETTASFSVNYDENVWYDHGIGEGGSIIDLVARMENCSVGEAIRRLENEVSGLGTLNVGDGVPRVSTRVGPLLFLLTGEPLTRTPLRRRSTLRRIAPASQSCRSGN